MAVIPTCGHTGAQQVCAAAWFRPDARSGHGASAKQGVVLKPRDSKLEIVTEGRLGANGICRQQVAQSPRQRR
jgi:hypothetical protein